LQASKAYFRFEKVALRSLNLLSLELILAQRGLADTGTTLEIADLSRAAIVLAVAAMDAYFTGIFAELFVPYLKKKGCNKHTCEILTKAGLNVQTAVELLTMERPLRRVRRLIDNYLDNRVTQKMHAIDSLFLAYTITNFSDRIQKLNNRRNLLRSVELLVTRRHMIVHDGDMNAHGRLRPIKPREITKRIKDLQLYVRGADELLRKQLG